MLKAASAACSGATHKTRTRSPLNENALRAFEDFTPLDSLGVSPGRVPEFECFSEAPGYVRTGVGRESVVGLRCFTTVDIYGTNDSDYVVI